MKWKSCYCMSYNNIIWGLTVILLSGFIIFEKYSWGKYLFLFLSGIIFIIDNIVNRGSFIPKTSFQIKFGLFIGYCFITSLWSLNFSNTIEFSMTLVLIYICLTLIMPYYLRKKNIDILLSVLMWSSIVVSVYTISFYGIDNLIAASKTQYIRLGNDYSNINTVGMFCAFGVVIQFERWLYNKKIQLSMFFTLISIFVVLCTQSRKAFLLIVIGCLIIVIMKNYSTKNILYSIIKITMISIFVIIFIFIMFQFNIFSGVQERLMQLFSVFTGVGELDSGSVNRKLLVELGMKIWKEYPILGIGLNCPRIIVRQELGFDAYIHNNFVELLCATGLIGFTLYYSMYVYILVQLLKLKRYNRRYYILGVMWVIISLIMDIGMVSYYGKIQCFYLMTQFLNIYYLKYKSIIKNTEGELC